jgi:hypothetical protein
METDEVWTLPGLPMAVVQVSKVKIIGEDRWLLRINCGHVVLTREQCAAFIDMVAGATATEGP